MAENIYHENRTSSKVGSKFQSNKRCVFLVGTYVDNFLQNFIRELRHIQNTINKTMAFVLNVHLIIP